MAYNEVLMYYNTCLGDPTVSNPSVKKPLLKLTLQMIIKIKIILLPSKGVKRNENFTTTKKTKFSCKEN